MNEMTNKELENILTKSYINYDVFKLMLIYDLQINNMWKCENMNNYLKKNNTSYFEGDFIFLGMLKDYSYEKCYEIYLNAARNNLVESYWRLGYLLINGIGVKQNRKAALKLFEKAALEGVYNGLILLDKYLNEEEKEDFIHCYKNFENENDSWLLNKIGEIYMKFFNKDLAKEYFEKALKLNNAKANYNMGYYYYQKNTIDNYEKANHYFNKAISLGYDCSFMLALTKHKLIDIKNM